MINVISRSDAYIDFMEDVKRMSVAYAVTIDVQVSRQEFDDALTIAQADADSFWERETTLNQALALMMTHAEEIVATTRGDYVIIVSREGYLSKPRKSG